MSTLPCRHVILVRATGRRAMPQAVAETGYVTLGGVPQWVEIRGADRTRPVLIVLHGGPGISETPFLRHFNRVLETRFTVVYWEQRGAGRSFSSQLQPTSMTISRFVADL